MISRENLEKLTSSIYIIHAPTNIGVLTSQDNMILVDTGMDDNTIEQAYQLLCETFSEKTITIVLNTHSHADHCGGDRFLHEKTGCRIMAPFGETGSIEEPSLQSAVVWGARPIKKMRTKFFCAPSGIKVDEGINENTILKTGSLTITPVALPGHYLDQYGFLVEDSEDGKKVFFTGDAMYGTETLRDYWIPFMYNVEEFNNSLTKIENTESDFFIPSHGNYYTEDNIHEITEMNKILLLEIESIITKTLMTPHTPEELLKDVADYAGIELSAGNLLLVLCTIKSYLSTLEEKGLVGYTVEKNRMLWHTRTKQD